MPDKEKGREEKLRKLGARLRQATAKLHPLSEEQVRKVRAAVPGMRRPPSGIDLDKDRERER